MNGIYYFVDIDECQLEIHSCEHICINTDGNYTCACDEGYMLDIDEWNCNGMSFKSCRFIV